MSQFRILMSDGHLSADLFLLAAQQPAAIKESCLLVVNERTSEAMTVHETRLFPADVPPAPRPHLPHHVACLKCGRVRGVVQDQVTCPTHGDGPCDLLEPRQ